jgi:hypothetical protein
VASTNLCIFCWSEYVSKKELPASHCNAAYSGLDLSSKATPTSTDLDTIKLIKDKVVFDTGRKDPVGRKVGRAVGGLTGSGGRVAMDVGSGITGSGRVVGMDVVGTAVGVGVTKIIVGEMLGGFVALNSSGVSPSRLLLLVDSLRPRMNKRDIAMTTPTTINQTRQTIEQNALLLRRADFASFVSSLSLSFPRDLFESGFSTSTKRGLSSQSELWLWAALKYTCGVDSQPGDASEDLWYRVDLELDLEGDALGGGLRPFGRYSLNSARTASSVDILFPPSALDLIPQASIDLVDVGVSDCDFLAGVR